MSTMLNLHCARMVTRRVMILVLMVALGCGTTRALDIEEDKLDSGEEYVIGIANKILEDVGVYVVTGEKAANVTIEGVAEIFVPSFSYQYVEIPRKLLTTDRGVGIENKSISIVVSSSGASLSLLRDRSHFPLFPIPGLGRRYILPSRSRAFVVATHSKWTQVNVTVGDEGRFYYNGTTYTYGDTLSLTLECNQTLTVHGYTNLTGTNITSDETIAVFIDYVFHEYYGSSSIERRYYYQHLPNEHFGLEYVVAVPFRAIYGEAPEFELQIFSEYNNTQIDFNDGTVKYVNTNGIYSQIVKGNQSFYFNSSQPVFTALIDIFGVYIVPPTTLFTTNTVLSSDSFKVLTTRDAMISVRSSTNALPKPYSVDVPGTNYKIVEFEYDQHTNAIVAINSTNSSFSVVSQWNQFPYDFPFLTGYRFQTTSKTSVSTSTQPPLTTATSSSTLSLKPFQYALVFYTSVMVMFLTT